jgi:hypothetical protein
MMKDITSAFHQLVSECQLGILKPPFNFMGAADL